MGNSCCFKKPIPVQHPDNQVAEKTENKPAERIANTTLEVQVKPKLDKQREQTISDNNSEMTEHMRVLEQKRVAMIPRLPEKDLLMSSATKPCRHTGKDGASKESGQTKFKSGELGGYRPGKFIYGSSETKYKILECLDGDTGKLFSLKMIQVCIDSPARQRRHGCQNKHRPVYGSRHLRPEASVRNTER